MENYTPTPSNNYFETIIIGAGPAGLIAGWYLDNALILDKKQEIGTPVNCGEGISRKAMERQGIKPDTSWISSVIDSIQTIMPDGKAFGGFYNEAGYVIDRTKFEKFLASKSKAKIQLNTKVVDIKLSPTIALPRSEPAGPHTPRGVGAGEATRQSPPDNRHCEEGYSPTRQSPPDNRHCEEGYSPTRQSPSLYEITTDNNQIFKSKYIIGADGPNSITRKKFFQEKINFVPAIEYVVKLEKEVETNIIKIFFDNEKYSDGYAWIFPKGKNIANIGLGGNNNLQKTFNEFLENTIKPNYGNYELLKNKSGIIPFDDIKISDNKRVMLVGDAAGLVEPILGGGINQAMWSGRIAAQCILNNEINLYESKIKSLPFANPELFKASKIFYSLNNKSLNKLGEIIGKKGNQFLIALQGTIKLFLNPSTREDALKFLKLFSIYQKTKSTFF